MKQVTGKSSLQGYNHIIWDSLISQESMLMPYLDYILDKEVVIQSAKKSVKAIKERLNKKLIDYAKNTVDFLNGLTEEDIEDY